MQQQFISGHENSLATGPPAGQSSLAADAISCDVSLLHVSQEVLCGDKRSIAIQPSTGIGWGDYGQVSERVDPAIMTGSPGDTVTRAGVGQKGNDFRCGPGREAQSLVRADIQQIS